MGTDRRARQKANRAKKLEEEEKQERRAKARRNVILGLGAIAALAAVIFLISITGGGEDDDLAAETASTSTTEALVSAVSAPEPGGSIDGVADCPAEDGSSERVTSFAEAPPMCIDTDASYTAVMQTTLGEVTMELDAALAPETVNNFVFLARYHYYDGAPFHRIIPEFMIQGGDASGDPLGTGSPGYVIDEEEPDDGAYEVGSVAMAKGQGPTATGAQFFIVTGPDGVALAPEYSLFGTVTDGMDVVFEIEAIPTTGQGDATTPPNAPTEEIYIESVSIEQS